MNYSDTYFTVVFRNPALEERRELTYHEKFSAGSYSHAIHDVSELLDALKFAEAALSDIGDADREEGDDLAWCENRAAMALPRIRRLLAAHQGTKLQQ
jgi:hypothetical protein